MQVRILGVDYAIVVSESLKAVPAHGCVEGTELPVIYLNPDTRKPLDRQTALHEALHVYDDRLSIGLGEKKVGLVAESVWSLIRDNPDFVKWLLTETPAEGTDTV